MKPAVGPERRLRAAQSPEEAGALDDIDRAWSTTDCTARDAEIWEEARRSAEALGGWLWWAVLMGALIGGVVVFL